MRRSLAIILSLMIAAGCAASPGVSPASSAADSPAPAAAASELLTDEPVTPAPSGPAAPSPTTEPVETADLSEAGPGLWAQSPPDPYLMNAAVRVLVAELNVRERPSTSARKVGEVTPDNVLAVSSVSPIEADGYIWYQGVVVSANGALPPLPRELGGTGEQISGWFAATKGSTAYVSLLQPRCPSVVDLVNVQAMLEAERLACFGDRTIELEGTFGCRGCSIEITGRYAPPWLAYPGTDILWETWMEDQRPLRIRFPPTGVGPPEPGSIIRVRGHFRDEAAIACQIVTFYPWEASLDDPPVHVVSSQVSRHLCLQEFVVETHDVVGSIDLSGG